MSSIQALVPTHKTIDLTPDKPYPRKPSAAIRKVPLSVAIGMICDHGIILASDSKFRTNGNVQYGQKIYPLQARQWMRVVVAGTGVVGFVKSAAQKIEAALPVKPCSLSAVSAIIEATNKNFFEQFVIANRSSSMPFYGVLIGIAHNDGYALLHTTENSTAQVDSIETEGTGGVVAEPYRSLWRKDIPEFEAELAAIFMVEYAKLYDSDNCGGDTKVFTLLQPDVLLALQGVYIQIAADYFKDFTRLGLDLLLPIDFLEGETEYYRSGIDRIVRQSSEARKNLVRMRLGCCTVVP